MDCNQHHKTIIVNIIFYSSFSFRIKSFLVKERPMSLAREPSRFTILFSRYPIIKNENNNKPQKHITTVPAINRSSPYPRYSKYFYTI